MTKSLPIAACTALLLTGCVAPEEPATARSTYVAPVTTTRTDTSRFEDAPIPNRAARRGADDSIIRLAH